MRNTPTVATQADEAASAEQSVIVQEVMRPAVTNIPLSPLVLAKLSQSLPVMRELANFAGGPHYEAFFKGGAAAQLTKVGNLSPVQHDGKKITEVAKLRSLRPGQFANLGFSFVTTVVGMEHMARIDRQLAKLNEKMNEIAAMLADELAAPIKDVAGSIHRFNMDGAESVPQDTADSWIRDLRRVRQRLIAKLERVPDTIKPTDRFWWGGQIKDLQNGAVLVREAIRFIEPLTATDAMLYRMAVSLNSSWALDGVDPTVAAELARRVGEASVALMKSTDQDAKVDSSGQRNLQRKEALGETQHYLGKLIEQIDTNAALQSIALRLMDPEREFRLQIENNLAVGLSEVSGEWAKSSG